MTVNVTSKVHLSALHCLTHRCTVVSDPYDHTTLQISASFETHICNPMYIQMYQGHTRTGYSHDIFGL